MTYCYYHYFSTGEGQRLLSQEITAAKAARFDVYFLNVHVLVKRLISHVQF